MLEKIFQGSDAIMKGLQYTYIGYEKDGFKTWVEFDNIEYDAKVKRWRNSFGQFVSLQH